MPTTPSRSHAADQIAYDVDAQAWIDTLHEFGDPIVVGNDTIAGGRSRSVIENAHNEHFWTGILSTLRHEVNDRVSLMAGWMRGTTAANTSPASTT